MLRHKKIDRICCIVLAATLLLTCGFMGAAATGVIAGRRSIGYENRLFDQSRVHTIDIVMDDWDVFLENCTNEEYAACTVVIDGESFGSTAIRAKGNTSLSSVRSYGNDRYSFKIEFDHYQSGRTYHGLDKLSLNNLIQDKTYLKDYLAYTLMNRMGAAAPLCSFAQINVNGEPWGLYLAVEAVEDSFLSRNYGSGHGELYKPDSMSFGGGRGNGRDFDMEAFAERFRNGEFEMPEGFNPARMGGFNPKEMAGGGFAPAFGRRQMEGEESSERGGEERQTRGFGGGIGSSDVMLQYIDDDPASYSNIFGSAKTDITEADQQRLIGALKKLTEGTEIESAADTDAVIRYLVVHNFLCNGDSYTGSMVHNYYLYEENGALSMIPWDYNLAFGAFNMGGVMGAGATSAVNSPIDSPVSSGDISSRPMISWIFGSKEYIARYHELYAEFIDTVFESGWMAEELERLGGLLMPYVKAETRAFFTAEEFAAGIAELKEFCELRARSIAGQLDGSIPSTAEGQRGDSSALVDASGVDLSAMGEFRMGGMNMMQRGTYENGWSRTREREMFGSESNESAEQSSAEGANPTDEAERFGGRMPAAGQMMPPEGFGGMQTDAQSRTMQQTPEAASGDKTPVVVSDGTMKTVPQSIGHMLQMSGGETSEGNAGMLFGCAAFLLAAILFVKFYNVNR